MTFFHCKTNASLSKNVLNADNDSENFIYATGVSCARTQQTDTDNQKPYTKSL